MARGLGYSPSISSIGSYSSLCPTESDSHRRSKAMPVRFEAAWLLHESFKGMLVNSWRESVSTPEALTGLREKLRRWNRDVFGDVNKHKDDLMKEIKIIQDLLELQQTDDLLSREELLLKELEVVMEQEELVWFQK